MKREEEEEEEEKEIYVANFGDASYDEIAGVFSSRFGQVRGVRAADESGTSRVIVCFTQKSSAQAALQAFFSGDDGTPTLFAGRSLHVRPPRPRPRPPTTDYPNRVNDFVSVCLEASELQIPGIHLLHDFVTSKQEEELLMAVDARPWKNLAKRRVQHYGYEFLYETRNVNTQHNLGELPSFLSPILKKISFLNVPEVGSIIVDQLTVNEYPPGVGLSPHIDTHSSFEGFIFSLSLGGPCTMEFRKYSQGSWLPSPTQPTNGKGNSPEVIKKSLFLPPRSMLLLSGEARYAWHHYIPHHKVDNVRGDLIERESRRVSFTLRKVRNEPCCCEFEQYCDSRPSE